MEVLVDGEIWSTGSTAGRRWTFARDGGVGVAGRGPVPDRRARRGTFGGGCGLDLDRWLPEDCVVTLRVEGLGSLRNPVERYSTSPSPLAHEVV